MRLVFSTAIFAILAWSKPGYAYIVNVFGPSTYSPDPTILNTNLGLTDPNFIFEDFDDAVLIPKLQVTPEIRSFRDVPYVADEPIFGGWTDNTGLHHVGSEALTFSVLGDGTSIFGVGLINVQSSNNSISINNDSFLNYTSLPGFERGSFHNGYLVIEAEAGDAAIQSITFGVQGSDYIRYDHVAILDEPSSSVPEPSTLLGLGTLALAGCTLLRRKRKA